MASDRILHLESVGEGVAVVDDYGVDAGDARPALDRGDDRLAVADFGTAFDAADEGRADDALVHEGLAFFQAPGGGELRHARGGSGTAGRTVDRLLAVEHRIARTAVRGLRLAGPHHVSH